MQCTFVIMCVFVLLQPSFGVEGKLCGSVEIKKNFATINQLRNCSVIVGYLKIAVIVTIDESEFKEFVFPELKEITGYLLFHHVRGLRSLSELFPNLRVIRGKELFDNYALIMFRMDNLEEIGLKNLLYIENGRVYIDRCPKLCYADTIDWAKIGTNITHYEKNTNCLPCARECGGYCWNSYTCQQLDTDKCHKECLGCSIYNSSRHCNTCKNLENDGECVQKCPDNKYHHLSLSKCVTKEECSKILNSTWFVFNKTCTNSCPAHYEFNSNDGVIGCKYCGEKCVKYCDGYEVDSLEVLQALEGCTHINGSLEIVIDKPELIKYLNYYLGKIVKIIGSLTIRRSSALTNLNFLSSLKQVNGKEFLIYDNPNLQQLWNFSNFNIILNDDISIVFHENPLLCIDEINNFLNKTGKTGNIDKKLIDYSNGYKSFCNIKDIPINVIEKNSTYIYLSWPDLKKNDSTIIGYTLYYINAIDDINSVSDESICLEEGWISIFLFTSTYNMTNLKPFTTYSYYIKIMSQTSQQTSIYNITTLPDDPSEPIDFHVNKTTPNSVILQWLPPQLPNGNLSHYLVTYVHEPDYLPFIENRDYCKYPPIELEDNDNDNDEIEQIETKQDIWIKNNTNCSCQIEEEQDDDEEGKTNVFNQDIHTLCDTNEDNPMCKRLVYYQVDDDINKTIKKRNSILKYQDIIVPAYLNETKIDGLRHFSLYIFYLSACNYNITEKRLCSPIIMISAKTKRNISADSINNIKLFVDNANVTIEWDEPKNPNSIILSYEIEYQRLDSEHSKAITECVNRNDYNKKKSYTITQLPSGKYSLRVRSMSLAGPATFTDFYTFEIETNVDNFYWIIFLFFGLILLICIGLFMFYQWYKKKENLNNSNFLITNVNPDYAGPIYEIDEWEIDRSDIKILRELGNGSFGKVYEGFIKSQGLPCAIKTISETATDIDKMEFLNEGSVMKSFCDAHHVVKLIGIVSKGDLPFVVMELMERGDLKSFLRRCREPSQSLTSNEMYLMAAEIADGMAYLSAKKFVHRDLAARNCMVAADRTVKIGDFGMARDIYETDYYRKNTAGLFPVRWMSPESLADGVFTSDSDCWSYGIVLWEIATLAEQPYQGLSNEDVLRFVKNGGKLNRPSECSDIFYEIMDACWAWYPNDRPTFFDIVEKLSEHVSESFRLVSFCFSDKGREFSINSAPRPYNAPAMKVIPKINDVYSTYNVSDEDVNLCIGENSRPKNQFFPFTLDQRIRKQSPKCPSIKPGSPDSYSFNSDNS